MAYHRTIPAWTAAALAIVTLATSLPANAQDQETELEHHRRIYERYTPDNFDDGGAISHHVWKNFPAFFPHAVIARTGPARPLALTPRQEVADFTVTIDGDEMPLGDYVAGSPLVDGMLVLAGGRIVYEAYPRMQMHDRHLGWSVTKVVVATALAALEHQGKVQMDEPVETYVPDLKRTAWAGIRVRDIVNMASGINCLDSDGYQNTESCIYRYEESLGLTARYNPPEKTMKLLQSMKRHRAAGTKYEYVSADTYVSGLVIENVTGQPLASALQSLIWKNVGPEADGMLMISPDGNAAAHAGLSARLRDIARFGQIFTSGGMNVVAGNHLTDLKSRNGITFSPEQIFRLREVFGDDTPSHAAWQWDMIWPDGAMFKGGYSGQGLFIDPDRDVVIAFFGTADEQGQSNRLLAVSRQLVKSGLLDQ